MRSMLLVLLLLPAALFGFDILRGKPSDPASEGLIIVLFTRIDSVNGRTIYGQRITTPDSMSVRDTIPWQITVTWARVDTLLGITLALDTTTVQMRRKYIAGVLRPTRHAVGSSVVASAVKDAKTLSAVEVEASDALVADSVWLAERRIRQSIRRGSKAL